MEIRYAISAGCLAMYPQSLVEAEQKLKRLARKRIAAEMVSEGRVVGGVREVDGKFTRWIDKEF